MKGVLNDNPGSTTPTSAPFLRSTPRSVSSTVYQLPKNTMSRINAAAPPTALPIILRVIFRSFDVRESTPWIRCLGVQEARPANMVNSVEVASSPQRFRAPFEPPASATRYDSDLACSILRSDSQAWASEVADGSGLLNIVPCRSLSFQ